MLCCKQLLHMFVTGVYHLPSCCYVLQADSSCQLSATAGGGIANNEDAVESGPDNSDNIEWLKWTGAAVLFVEGLIVRLPFAHFTSHCSTTIVVSCLLLPIQNACIGQAGRRVHISLLACSRGLPACFVSQARKDISLLSFGLFDRGSWFLSSSSYGCPSLGDGSSQHSTALLEECFSLLVSICTNLHVCTKVVVCNLLMQMQVPVCRLGNVCDAARLPVAEHFHRELF